MARKKKLLVVTAGILFFTLIIPGVYFIARSRTGQKNTINVSDVMPYLKDGDIILRLSDSPWSSMFRNFSLTDKRFSHLGIARIRDKDISVINSVGYITQRERGVEEVSLEKFLQVAKAIGVFRAKSITDGAIISDKAAEYTGYPFDWDFDIRDESKIYCTELLYVALKYAAPEIILPTIFLDITGKEIIPLESVSNSSDFDEIIYICTSGAAGLD